MSSNITDNDFVMLDVELTFLPGYILGDAECVNITLIDDVMVENDESFLVLLTSSSANTANDTSTITIIDNEVLRKSSFVQVLLKGYYHFSAEPVSPVVVGLRDVNVTVSEGDTVVCCVEILSGEAMVPHTVLLASITGTASG